MPTMMMTIPPQQADSILPSLTPSPPAPNELPQQVPVNLADLQRDLAALQRQIRENMEQLDRLFPLLKPMTLMSTLPQPDPHLYTTPSTTANDIPRELCDLATLTSRISPGQLPLTLQPQSDAKLANLSPEPIAHLNLVPEILSRIGRLLHNTRTCNTTLWMPAALSRSTTPNQLPGHRLSPVNHPTRQTVTFPVSDDIPCPVNNPLEDRGVTTRYTPAFDIHLSWPVNGQKYPLTPQRRLLVTTVKAFAHNRRPP